MPEKNLDHLPGQIFELLMALAAQIPAGQFLVPGPIGKLLNGLFVNGLDALVHVVLLEKGSQAFVEAGIVGIVIHLATEKLQHGERPSSATRREM